MPITRDLQDLRQRVRIGFALTVLGAASGEWLKAMIFPERQDILSHAITMVIATAVGTVAALWVLRRQADLQQRMTAEMIARTRLEELQAQLIERTVELE